MAFEGKSYVTGGPPELKSPDPLALMCFACLVFEIIGGCPPQKKRGRQALSTQPKAETPARQTVIPLALLVHFKSCSKVIKQFSLEPWGYSGKKKKKNLASSGKGDERYSKSKHCGPLTLGM